jgi:hypothetical protein
MIRAIKRKIEAYVLDLAIKRVTKYGLIPVKIKRVAGTDYIEASDGSMRKINGKHA